MTSHAGRTPERVRVVVVNHNAGEVTLRCLDALAGTDWPADRLEVVLVDNGSHDGVAEEVRRTRPHVVVLASAENEGFGRACNRAMEDLGGVDHVALINNDAVPETGWLSPLVRALEEDAGLGAVSPKVLLDLQATGVVLTQDGWPPAVLTVGDLSLDGRPLAGRVTADERFRPALGGRPHRWSTRRPEAGIWWVDDETSVPGRSLRLSLSADGPADATLTTRAERVTVAVGRSPTVVELVLPDAPEHVINSVGGVLYDGWFGGDRGYLELDRGQYDVPADVFSWSGAAVLLRADYLRDVGLFNPAFFLYYEDIELSWRGRLKGWRYRTVPASVVHHQHGFTTGIGSARFRAWEDRSRWMTLVELAPPRTAVRALGGGLRRALARGEAGLAASGLRPSVRGRRRLAIERRGTATIERWRQPRPGSW